MDIRFLDLNCGKTPGTLTDHLNRHPTREISFNTPLGSISMAGRVPLDRPPLSCRCRSVRTAPVFVVSRRSVVVARAPLSGVMVMVYEAIAVPVV